MDRQRSVASLAQIQADCETATRRRGADIHARKGYTSYGIAAAVCRISASILRNEGRIFTVSARALPEYGIGTEVALGLPCTIGRKGVARRLLLQLDAEEHGRLEKSAMLLATAYRSLVLTSKKGISSLQIHRMMGFGSYSTALYMCQQEQEPALG